MAGARPQAILRAAAMAFLDARPRGDATAVEASFTALA
jgi:hypothetical protein